MPRLLDLFCGAGGASVGYARAGFDVVGVDKRRQPDYPFTFVRGDAMEILEGRHPEIRLEDFDLIHASPPCQAFSRAAIIADHSPGRSRSKVDLLTPTRAILEPSPHRYVIENVEGAPIRAHVRLCGTAFGLPIERHRWFQLWEGAPFAWSRPCAHLERPIGIYGRPGDHFKGKDSRTGRIVYGGRTAANLEEGLAAMGIDWITRWHSLAEAIPPAYTEWIGRAVLA